MRVLAKDVIVVFVLAFASCGMLSAQSNQFGYQGSLNSGGSPANGNYDFEFALYDALNAGSQVGAVLSRNNVPVANGVFAVRLDFGSSFPGAGRFLEIRVRPAGQPGITILTPRQPIDSAPYSVKSLSADTAATATNATQLGGVAANQFVVTTDPRMSDARTPTAGSGDYVQNRATPQAGTNFNISGNGTAGGTLSANVVSSATNFRIGGATVLSIAGLAANTFVGDGAGTANTATFNTFVGRSAGAVNTSGASNSFFGAQAGLNNTTGTANAFFGSSTGAQNTVGENNAFFGSGAGSQGTTGSNNAFFGWRAGRLNSGNSNAFFGAGAGDSNTTGLNNAFFGANAGAANTVSIGNSFFGANAGAANVGQFNSFFGVSSGLVNTTGFNNSFFGTVSGVANTTGASNSFFGHWAGHDNSTGNSNAFFGAFAGEATTNGDTNSFFGRSAGEFNTTGNGNTFIGNNAGVANIGGSNNTTLGAGADITGASLNFATAIGAGAVVTQSNFIHLGRNDGSDGVGIPGQLYIGTVPGGGNTNLCRGSVIASLVSTCSSSLRYKTAVETFTEGLSIVRRLRPISFDWKDAGLRDVGFAAEEVSEIEPLLVTYENGRIEGVKYAQVTTVLVNAVKEQQAEIDDLRQQVRELKELVCAQKPSTSLCARKEVPRVEGDN